MEKYLLKNTIQDLKQDEILDIKLYKIYEEEYLNHIKQYDEERFIHANNIRDINTIFQDIILNRLDYVNNGKIINQYKCCINGCIKISLYEMKYKENIKYICWFHLCNVINKY
jgi:hypothetical protein